MEFEADCKEGLLFDNNKFKNEMEDGFYLDFDKLDQFSTNGPSLNSGLAIQNTCFYPFFNGSSSKYIDIYETKPFAQNGRCVENFQRQGNYFNQSHGTSFNATGSNQSRTSFNLQEIKNFNLGLHDEMSCITAENGYYRNVSTNKNYKCNSSSASSSKKYCKNGKKSNVVKGQWTVEEDR